MDDLFSSDLTDAELENIYSHVQIPTLWVWGMEDEYMPKTIDKRHHAERVCMIALLGDSCGSSSGDALTLWVWRAAVT